MGGFAFVLTCFLEGERDYFGVAMVLLDKLTLGGGPFRIGMTGTLDCWEVQDDYHRLYG